MTPPLDAATARPITPPVPRYMHDVYWWAYVHPRAIEIFERDWLVNTILFGSYAKLRDAALAELGDTVRGSTLQVACVYGNLTPKLQSRMAPDARLDVVDIMPIQLQNLAAKLKPDDRVHARLGDSSRLDAPDASYDQVLMFFLLHEQPEDVRRATLAEAWRVVKPGGKVIIVDYHAPRWWHPMRPVVRGIFAWLEPYAMDLWRHPVTEFLPADIRPEQMRWQGFFGNLYQKLVLTR